MIFNWYKQISKFRQLITFRYNESSSSVVHTSETGSKIKKKTDKKTNAGKESKSVEQTTTDIKATCVPPKHAAKEKLAENYESIVVEDKKTENSVKKVAGKKEKLTSKKDGHLVLDPFVIQNIMSFPLHSSADDIKFDDKSEVNRKKFPSVTSILQETMSPENRKVLEAWKQKMTEIMGPEKFMTYQIDPVKKVKIKRLSMKAKRSKKIIVATLNRGSRFHNALKTFLDGEDWDKIQVHKDVEGCWESVKTILPSISDVKLVECDIFHPYLQYKGIVDCVASYKNVPHVIEWKQSEKVKKDLSSTYDAPLQLTAYMGALPWCNKVDLTAPISNGLVVIAYCDGAPADVFPMNLDFCQSYWEQWLRRVQQYWMSKSVNEI